VPLEVLETYPSFGKTLRFGVNLAGFFGLWTCRFVPNWKWSAFEAERRTIL